MGYGEVEGADDIDLGGTFFVCLPPSITVCRSSGAAAGSSKEIKERNNKRKKNERTMMLLSM